MKSWLWKESAIAPAEYTILVTQLDERTQLHVLGDGSFTLTALPFELQHSSPSWEEL